MLAIALIIEMKKQQLLLDTNYLINVNHPRQPSIETHDSEVDTSQTLLPSIESIVHDPMPIDALKLLTTTTKTKSKIEIRRVPTDHVPLVSEIPSGTNVTQVSEAQSTVTQMQSNQESPIYVIQLDEAMETEQIDDIVSIEEPVTLNDIIIRTVTESNSDLAVIK